MQIEYSWSPWELLMDARLQVAQLRSAPDSNGRRALPGQVEEWSLSSLEFFTKRRIWWERFGGLICCKLQKD